MTSTAQNIPSVLAGFVRAAVKELRVSSRAIYEVEGSREKRADALASLEEVATQLEALNLGECEQK